MQGSGAEYCLASLAPILEWIDDDCVPAQVVLTVHDSIVALVRDEAVAEYIEVATEIMEGHPSGPVLLRVDAERGKRWGSLREV